MAPVAAFSDVRYETLWTVAKDVLRRHGFKLDQTDVVNGHITTHPVGSAHFFEFWRDDVASPRDAWEATLVNMRRRATVDISRSPGTDGCRIVVLIHKQRFSSPERLITNSAAASHFLSSTLPTATGGEEISAIDSRWIDRGRDPAMEAKLRKEILDRAAIRDQAPPSTSSLDP